MLSFIFLQDAWKSWRTKKHLITGQEKVLPVFSLTQTLSPAPSLIYQFTAVLLGWGNMNNLLDAVNSNSTRTTSLAIIVHLDKKWVPCTLLVS